MSYSEKINWGVKLPPLPPKLRLSEGFKRSVYWNKYQAILKDHADNENIRKRIDASFQCVNKLFVLAYVCGDNVNNENSYRYFLPRLKIKKIITLKLMIEIFMIIELT